MAHSFEIGPFSYPNPAIVPGFCVGESEVKISVIHHQQQLLYPFQARPLCRAFSFQEDSHGNTGNRVYSRGTTGYHGKQGGPVTVQQVNAVEDGW
jgi:hypothetical protein